jgi:cell division protein FtsI (penicillin-binding protein 3)/stage V sporulation protein D (sporulation-specific penicillin-binding protein)
MNRNEQARAAIICFALVGVFSLFSVRLIYLQVLQHDVYVELAAEKHVHKQLIYARRGVIRGSRGEPLAENRRIYDVAADGSHIRNPTALAQAIAGQLEMDPAELEAKLKAIVAKTIADKKAESKVLKKGVSEEVFENISKITKGQRQLAGIYFDLNFERVYPNGSLLAQVIGFMDAGHEPRLGIERSMQDFLKGTNGCRFLEEDQKGHELVQYRGLETPAKDGCDVRLTIDMQLQNIVESELDAACLEYKPKMAAAVMIRPQTGEILAMASRPTFDCNDPRSSTPDQQKNRPIVDMVEPGSTFKIVVTSAAVEEKVATPETKIYCENGAYAYAGHILHDAHPMGMLTLHQVLAHSSNIGAAKLAIQLGKDRFYQYIRRYGFGETTGISLPGEISGLVNPPYRWSELDITRVPMGQSVAVTPLQLVTAMSAVANGGILMKPILISEIDDADGRPVVTYSPVQVRRVISTDTSRKIVSALKDVVSRDGTAKDAAVPGFAVAGKTGTAQKIDPRGGYLEGRYVVSFVGFLPADDPKFTLLVVIDDPEMKEGKAFGGTVAAPVFARIAKRVADYLGLQPANPVEPPGLLETPKKLTSTLAGRG